ncbi:MAG: SGNH/GDSL hydrolase family protein [Kiritimatiellia bacterium]
MKKLTITSLVLTMVSFALSGEKNSAPGQKIQRENIEWCDIWIPSATKTDKPRILLAGDSISRGYYKSVCKLLKGQAYCCRFSTSACVADPAFHVQLQAMFTQYKYDIIHFNNGLHGTGYTEEEYKGGYEKVLKYIRKVSPSSKIVLALSTPLNPESSRNNLNPRIDERNKIVRKLGKMYGAGINDLHSVSKDHPEYYKDPYHYKKTAIDLQSKQVAEQIKKLLNGTQENASGRK